MEPETQEIQRLDKRLEATAAKLASLAERKRELVSRLVAKQGAAQTARQLGVTPARIYQLLAKDNGRRNIKT